MGNTRSCDNNEKATAMLILKDGNLEEFTHPIKVSQIVRSKKLNPNLYFICNADEMEFDAFVRGLPGDETLELGQLYFELPVSSLKRPLQGEEIAALAVKAVSIIKSCNKSFKGFGVLTRENMRQRFEVPTGEKMRQRIGGRGSSRCSKWSNTLCSVPEET